MYGFTALCFSFTHGVVYAIVCPLFVAFRHLFTLVSHVSLHLLRAGACAIPVQEFAPPSYGLDAWLSLTCC
jgi:hypothetical protein